MGKRAIPPATRRAVARRYGCTPGSSHGAWCWWCGTSGWIHWHRFRDGTPSAWVTFQGLEMDHLIPELIGGTGDPHNIVLACQGCNRGRRLKPMLPYHFRTFKTLRRHCGGRRTTLREHCRNREQGREQGSTVVIHASSLTDRARDGRHE